jgi:hypothetical protein
MVLAMLFDYRILLKVIATLLTTGQLSAIIFLDTADPGHNTTTPGGNSGWQYEGKFGDFLGVPIAPHFFITAKHIGGGIGQGFDFHGDLFTTIAFHEISGTDLRIWEVEHAKPFPTYAPLSSGVSDVGSTTMVIGRGTQRGSEVSVSGEFKGWEWGAGDGVKRWGRNQIARVETASGYGELLACDFDKPGGADECHLSVGDSGGGMFVFEEGLWRLAGIHLSVDGPFRFSTATPGFNAALYDAAGLECSKNGSWVAIPEQLVDVSSSFYSSRISASLPQILAIAPAAAALAPEDFASWQRLYFSPAEIAIPATGGPLADYDQDGIGNLLEFALNLDPTFHDSVTMTATGVSGLPLAKIESISPSAYLTLEFVRRTSSGGSGVTTVAEFSNDLITWTASGSETVTALNSRWERVKTVDSVAAVAAVKRFTRVKVR